MRKKFAFIAIVGAFALLLGFLSRNRALPTEKIVLVPPNGNGMNETLPSHVVAKQSTIMQAFQDAFKTTIELYGEVEDQHGNPIAGATVKLTPVDSPSGDQSKSQVTLSSDADGKFSATGLRGFSMGVQAMKNGYLYLSPLGGPTSSAMIQYANGADTGKRFSNPATPLILTLHKVGPLEPILYIKKTRWKIPIDGTIRKIALDSKEGVGKHQIEFRLWSNTLDRDKPGANVYDPFNWTFEASIPSGGFIWNDSDYNFDAPEIGYKESIRYDHPSSQPREKWVRFQNGRYFVKFADGSHGRIRIDIDAGIESDYGPLSMTSWLNLKSGSKNLASPEMDGSGFHGGDPEME